MYQTSCDKEWETRSSADCRGRHVMHSSLSLLCHAPTLTILNQVAYRLYDSLYTKRIIRLSALCENFKRAGLPSGEASRIRQYERFLGESIENLRMIKNYRTPQTLRSFARLFTTLLPPFFAPTYAQIAVVRFICLYAFVSSFLVLIYLTSS